MSFCTQCGFELKNEKAFCPQCGSPTGSAAPAPAEAETQAMEPVLVSEEPVQTEAAQAQCEPVQEEGAQPASETASAQPEPVSQGTQQFQPQPVTGAAPSQIAPPAPTDFTHTFDSEEVAKNKVFATGSYLLGFIGIVIALLAAKDSEYVKFHVRESMKIQVLCALLGLASVLLCLASVLLCWTIIIPILGCIAIAVLGVIEIICMVRAMMGQSKKVPLIGNWKMF